MEPCYVLQGTRQGKAFQRPRPNEVIRERVYYSNYDINTTKNDYL